MRLDPRRRWFTKSEVTAAWLRQDRQCLNCRRLLPRDLVEGDHIVPWSRGGRTTMDNLQALCVTCNRQKGNRSVGTYSPPEVRDVRQGDGRLREWQKRALEVVEQTDGPILIEACPGAGKTRFALEAAYRMFELERVNRLLIVAPTVRIVQQWVEAAEGMNGLPKLPLAPPDWRPTSPIYETLCGAALTWATLLANTTQIEALAAEPGYRSLVILDEVHHAGVGHAFGLSAQQAFNNAAHRVVSLTGTAFRTDDPIVFVRTAERLTVPSFTYTYGEALVDGACRPVQFVHIAGSTSFETPDSQVHEVTFDDDLTDRGSSYRLRTALDPRGDLLGFMLSQADADLARLRTSGDPDAGALVVCMDCDHADAVAELLDRITGSRPDVAYSRTNDANDLTGSRAIEMFTKGSQAWLVSVAMVSEGVDIRRLRAIVYATNVLTELAFRQIVGRVVRRDPKNGSDDFGIAYMVADPRMVKFAEDITGTADVVLPSPIVIRDTSRNEPVRILRLGDSPSGEFQPLASDGIVQAVTDATGRQVPGPLFELARKYIERTSSRIPAFELAVLASTDDKVHAQLLKGVGSD